MNMKLENSSMSRDVRIEGLRIFGMILIIACHGILHLPWLLHVDQGLTDIPGWKTAFEYLIVQYGQVGVCIFFIISGYFLVNRKFHWTRFFKPWLQMIVYTVSAFLVIWFAQLFYKIPSSITLMDTPENTVFTVARAFMPFLFNAYWFMTAYLVMILISPYINVLFDSVSKKNIERLMFILAFIGIWMLLGNRVYEWNNVFYASLGYMVGAWIRRYAPTTLSVRQRMSLWLTGGGVTVLMLIFNYAASQHNRVIAILGWNSSLKSGIWIAPIIIAGIIFLLNTREHEETYSASVQNSLVEKVITACASTTFGIYLIHENQFGYRILWKFWTVIFPNPQGMEKVFIFLLIIILTFCVLSVLVYVIDKLLVKPLQSAVLKKIQAE